MVNAAKKTRVAKPAATKAAAKPAAKKPTSAAIKKQAKDFAERTFAALVHFDDLSAQHDLSLANFFIFSRLCSLFQAVAANEANSVKGKGKGAKPLYEQIVDDVVDAMHATAAAAVEKKAVAAAKKASASAPAKKSSKAAPKKASTKKTAAKAPAKKTAAKASTKKTAAPKSKAPAKKVAAKK
jgi:hypothetical protein